MKSPERRTPSVELAKRQGFLVYPRYTFCSSFNKNEEKRWSKETPRFRAMHRHSRIPRISGNSGKLKSPGKGPRALPPFLAIAHVLHSQGREQVRRWSMTKRIAKGTCYLCQGEFSKATMTRHLEACQRRANEAAVATSQKLGRTTKQYT
jgi:hypothetical protein